MPSPLPPPRAERARPLLGTIVTVRAEGGAPEAIDDAFAEIASIQRLMSFHDQASDVSRLNREAHHHPIRVHPHTASVLRDAQQIAAASDGLFDVSVAPLLVQWGLLPAPAGTVAPDPAANWRDIMIAPDDSVRFARPLWIDLGGIAKGYAVDCAIGRLASRGVTQGCVNAGGDIRAFGPAAEWIGLRTDLDSSGALPAIKLRNASLASSGGRGTRRKYLGRWRGAHIHPRRGVAVGMSHFASVVTERCILADALTKLVLGLGRKSEPLLRQFGAEAHLFDNRHGWRAIGAGA